MQEQTRRTELPSGAEPLRPGDPRSIGSHELIGRLGEGGMGAVYLGRGGDGRPVAIKVIRPELAADAGFRGRFDDEVSNARKVASFCTAAVLDHGEENGRPYLVTEYVDGTPLEDYIETNGALPPGTLHGVAVGVAAALTAIHAAGLVHRDLKPSNVLLSVSGPRVIDFGIARATDAPSQHTQAGFVIGTPGWMAPEQVLNNEVTTAVDIFAWGCLVALAGTGRHPYGTGNAMVMAARASSAEPDLNGLSPQLRELVGRALAAAPERRPDAQQLLLALVGGAPGTPNTAAFNEQASTRVAEVAANELNRTWQPDALPPNLLPPPWIPPSPPHGSPLYAQPTPVPMYQPPPVHTAPPMRPPPTAPPRVVMPGYAPQGRQRNRGCMGCLIAAAVVIVIGVIAVVAIYFGTQPSEGRLNEPAKDGQFTFKTSGVRCGVTQAGLKHTGKLCRVSLSVENTGTKTRTFAPDEQELKDSDDSTKSGDVLYKGRNRVPSQLLTPGSKFIGYLYFDVPSSYEPNQLILHDAGLSNGVRFPAS